MNIDVRLLMPCDSEKYRDIRLESLRLHPECFGANYQAQIDLPQLFFEKCIIEQDIKNRMLGAFVNGDIVGLCGLIPTDDNRVKIIQMYIKQDFRGQGFSEQLLTAAKQTLQDKYTESSLILSVFIDNYAAIASYRKAGFSDLERVGAELFMMWESE